MTLPDALMLEPSDFIAFPVGGQTSFCRQMMSAFGNRLGLVGFSTDDTPVGKWTEKTFDGVTYVFFSIARVTPFSKKPLIPLRITSFFQFRKHRKAILSLGVSNAFTQAPETLLATYRWGWSSYCFAFPGIQNILNMSRYPWARPLAAFYEMRLARALKQVPVIIAAADQREIEAFAERTHHVIPAEKIISFPTRVDTTIFTPVGKQAARAQLRFASEFPMIFSCARISRRKGWDLVLSGFQIFLQTHPGAQLFYIGDGEDRKVLEDAVQTGNMQDNVFVLGFQSLATIALYDAACDVFANGSHFEGWPVAQLEAIACGAAVVSTDVSGARDLIVNGKNGYIVMDRDPQHFSEALSLACNLPDPATTSTAIAQQYAVSTLAAALGKVWPPLAC